MSETDRNNQDNDDYVVVGKDLINDFIEENEFNIPILNDSQFKNKIRGELRAILQSKETDFERENFLDEQRNKAEQKKWDNYIGSYAQIGGDRYGKDFRDFVEELKRNFILKQVPIEVRLMEIFEYHHEEWEILLRAIKEGYDSSGYNFPPYQKTLKKFFELNQRAYIVRKSYLQKYVIGEFLDEINSGKSSIPIAYRESWKRQKKIEKLKLRDKFLHYTKKVKMGDEEAIEKIFNFLKKNFNLQTLSDLDAGKEIKKITDITFIDEKGMLKDVSPAKTIRDYKRYK